MMELEPKGQEGNKYKWRNYPLNDIITPLFNPKDRGNKSKISYLIQQNFLGNELDLKEFEEYKDLIKYRDVVNILDFSRGEFNKSFSLTPKKEIKTKWKLVKLGDVVDIKIGGTPSRRITKYFNGDNLWVSIAEINGKTINDTKEKISDEGVKNSNVKLIPKGTTLLSFKLSIGKTAIAGKDLYTNEAIAGLIILDKNILLDKYLFYLFTFGNIDLENIGYKTFGKSLNSKFLKRELKIPLPPKDIQQKIVDECEIVDSEVQKAEETIKRAREEIEKIVTDEQSEYKKLSEVVIKVSEIINPKEEIGIVNYIGLENIESNTSQLVGDIKVNFSEIKSNKSVFRKDDILYGKLRPNLNKVYKADFDGICSTDILVFRPINKSLATYYKYYFLSKKFNQEVLKTVTGQQLPRTSWDKISSFKIPIPPLSKQKALIDEVEKLEAKIDQAKTIIEGAKERKEKVMEKYL